MKQVIRGVSDFDAGERLLLERILGGPLDESQRLTIQVIPSDLSPHNGARRLLPESILQYCRIYDGLTASETRILDRSIRRGPHLNRGLNLAHD